MKIFNYLIYSFSIILMLSSCGTNDNEVTETEIEITDGFNGSIDSSFATNGLYTDETIGDNIYIDAFDMAIDSNGNMYLSTYYYSTGVSDDSYVVKYDINGTPDSTFGSNGLLTFNDITKSTDAKDRITNIKVDNQNNIYITGYSTNSSNSGEDTIFIIKFDSNGTIDTNFGIDGLVLRYLITGENSSDTANDIKIDNDGNIYVLGYARIPSKRKMFLLKYDSNGTIVSSFGDTGKIVFDNLIGTESSTYAMSIILDSTEKFIYATGKTYSSDGDTDVYILKYDVNGILIDTFGDNGKIIIDNIKNIADESDEEVFEIILDKDDNIYIAGQTNRYSSQSNIFYNKDSYLTKYSKDGVLDTDFGIHGIVVFSGMSTSQVDSEDYARSLVIDEFSNIYFLGYTSNYSSDKKDLYITKLNNTGKIDSTFGIDGKVNFSDENINYYAYSIQIYNNSLIVGGIKYDDNSRMYILKFH